MTDSWLHFADDAFDFEFGYPAKADAGEVTVDQGPHPGGRHVHISTADSRTVYFEVSRTIGRSGDGEIAFLKHDVTDRFPGAWFSAIQATQLCGIGARSAWFRFADRVRWVVATEEPLPGYRVILDPRSSTNLAILGSLTLRPRQDLLDDV